jgi:hypothetical protein
MCRRYSSAWQDTDVAILLSFEHVLGRIVISEDLQIRFQAPDSHLSEQGQEIAGFPDWHFAIETAGVCAGRTTSSATPLMLLLPLTC